MEIIKTDRLILRQPQSSDKQTLSIILDDNTVKKYFPKVSLFLRFNCDYKNNFYFIIEEINSGKIIGLIYSNLFIDSSASTSYIIKAEERGKGYMPEALKAFIIYLYNNKVTHSMRFAIMKSNRASKKVMNKLKIHSNYSTKYYKYYTLSLQEKPSF